MLVLCHNPKPASRELNPLEEVDVGELLHFVRIPSLDNLLVVEQDPGNFLAELLADERDVVSVKND
jgi:hypothetical protein